ncbi:hypothetical protein CRUP_028431 [Coryphaenoides rupestris]|nr:hypothetical protein CRUP_028431 [Coryphaenoides rupestris]
MDDIDAMFSDMLGEMDLMTQSLGVEVDEPLKTSTSPPEEVNFSPGSADLNASLHELEDDDLDVLMADLMADLNATEEKLAADIESLKVPPPPDSFPPPPAGLPPAPQGLSSYDVADTPTPEEIEAQIKTEKIKMALEKLKEAKVKKLVVKVLMNDGSSKTLMVDERQSVRNVLDNLFEKTHCDCNVDWSLYETIPDLNLERGFEDHENLVEQLSAWTRDSENNIHFEERADKYEVFKNPQVSVCT